MEDLSQEVMDFIYQNACLKVVKELFGSLLESGDPSVISDLNVKALNEMALALYKCESLNESGVEALKYILMVCNVLYNRTDMFQLPIDDGFYDLLLEKYKTYDPNFQVGSAVVQMKSVRIPEPGQKVPECPIYKINPEDLSKDPINETIREDIRRTTKKDLNIYDFAQSPIYDLEPETLSKRYHNTAHNHPTLVGTLDKCKFITIAEAQEAGALEDPSVKILERDFFLKHIEAGILDPNRKINMVLELKYDGISVEADCTDRVISARTRGDTGIGEAADITPVLYNYPFKHAKSIDFPDTLGIKFEAIIKKSAMHLFNEARQYNYANCRTAIIGLFGANDANIYKDYITLVPLAVDKKDIHFENRLHEIAFLNEFFTSHGEPLRHTYINGTYVECLYLIKIFFEEAEHARDYLDFMYDGIVVSYMEDDLIDKLGRENFINKYQMAVKFNPLKKTTIFRGYTYTVGQNGQITPMLHYDPVEFLGTIHYKSTGSSLNRFLNMGLKYGDMIDVTYRNDVMPYVTVPDCEHNRNNPNPIIQAPKVCPICGSDIVVSDSGKSMFCPNMNCMGRIVTRTVNMLAKMNLKGFGESMVTAIDKYTLRELINLDMDYLAPRIGEGNAANFVDMMNAFKNNPIYDYVIVGALGFSSCASRTWKTIFNAIALDNLITIYQKGELVSFLSNLKGIGTVTALTIEKEFPLFIEDLCYIRDNLQVVSTLLDLGAGVYKKVRFTGVRDKELEKALIELGYDADSNGSVTKDTDVLIVPYKGYESTKTRKVSDKCKIIPIAELKNATSIESIIENYQW